MFIENIRAAINTELEDAHAANDDDRIKQIPQILRAVANRDVTYSTNTGFPGQLSPFYHGMLCSLAKVVQLPGTSSAQQSTNILVPGAYGHGQAGVRSLFEFGERVAPPGTVSLVRVVPYDSDIINLGRNVVRERVPICDQYILVQGL